MNKETINQLISILIEERMKVKLHISYLELVGDLDNETLNDLLQKMSEIDKTIADLEKRKQR